MRKLCSRAAVHSFCVATVLILGAAAAAERSVWDPVYSEAQSKRGRTIYIEACSKCHSENLTGGEGSPPLVGKEFTSKWNGKTVGALFNRTKKTMPPEDPGGFSNRQYADLIAYVLSANEFPAGTEELKPDATELEAIEIKRKGE